MICRNARCGVSIVRSIQCSILARKVSRQAANNDYRIFVTNIPDTESWQELKNHCRNILPDTPIGHCAILTEKKTGMSKGCGFVEMENTSDVDMAIEALNASSFAGSKLFARREVKTDDLRIDRKSKVVRNRRDVDLKDLRLFISNIPRAVDWKGLKDHCRKVLPNTPVAYCSISVDKETGRSKGHGIVQYDDPSDVARAIAALNGSTLAGQLLSARKDVKQNDSFKHSE